ncbi:MAG: T9SS type A sorting domain-containing protein [Flavobacteriaceae bacterium]
MNDVGSGSAYNRNITRLKTTQNLNLTIGGFLPGTITLTSYNYYANNGDLVLRTSDILISIPFLGINQLTSTKESLLTSVLATTRDRIAYSNLKIVPNPVENELNIRLENSDIIQSIHITDLSGREVLSKKGNYSSLQVRHLKTEIYIATEKGSVSQKFIKK